MNTAISCILLLACAVVCASQTLKDCRCVKMSKGMKPSLIADVKVYPPRPYCNKQEVIVILKDNGSRCLDPEQRFTQAVLQTLEMQRALQAAGMSTTTTSTTTSTTTATTSSTAAPTSQDQLHVSSVDTIENTASPSTAPTS